MRAIHVVIFLSIVIFLTCMSVNQTIALEIVGLINDMQGNVILDSEDKKADIGMDLHKGDVLIIDRDSSITITYYKSCRQETVGEKSIVEIGDEKSVFKHGKIKKYKIIDCGVSRVALGNEESDMMMGKIMISLPTENRSETVKGSGCSEYGKDDAREAKERALDEAKRSAIENSKILASSLDSVTEKQIKEDIIKTITDGYLRGLKVLKTGENEKEICVFLEANIDTEEVGEIIRQKVESKKTIKSR